MNYEQYCEKVNNRLDEIAREHGELITYDPEYRDPFSYEPCDVCGRDLAGERYKLLALTPGNIHDIYELIVCADCLLYSEYGFIDDFCEQ
jgi:hypothetical protein